MKQLVSFFISFFIFFSGTSFSKAIEPNYILQIFNSGDYPVLISDTHNILYEDFTATWCGWCHYSYEIYDKLREKFGKQIITLRYHNQDTLTMNNSTDRSGYYKVTGYPTMLFNGTNKLVGADDSTYPKVETLVSSLLEKEAKLGVYSTGFLEGRTIRMTSMIQSFSKEPLTGSFMTVFSESNVIFQKDYQFDFVARAVFPNFQGIKLTIEPGKIYIIQYSRVIPEDQKVQDFEAVSMFQNIATKEIYNSCAFQMDSLTIARSDPGFFQEEVSRDTPIVLEFQEGLVLGSIETAEMMIVSNSGEMIFLEPIYDRIKKTLTLYPLKLLNPLTGYFLLILGGESSLLSVNKRRLKTDVVIPFHTSSKPSLNLDVSETKIDFGDIFDFDLPEKEIRLQEQNGLSMRFKLITSDKWIEVSESVVFGSNIYLKVKINTLHMSTGVNQGSLYIITVLGNFEVHIEANLLSNEYPQIRFFNYFPYVFTPTVVLSGRTNGYRVFVGEKEIFVDNGGYFKIEFNISPEYNFFLVKSMNMQRKIGNHVVIFYRLKT